MVSGVERVHVACVCVCAAACHRQVTVVGECSKALHGKGGGGGRRRPARAGRADNGRRPTPLPPTPPHPPQLAFSQSVAGGRRNARRLAGRSRSDRPRLKPITPLHHGQHVEGGPPPAAVATRLLAGSCVFCARSWERAFSLPLLLLTCSQSDVTTVPAKAGADASRLDAAAAAAAPASRPRRVVADRSAASAVPAPASAEARAAVGRAAGRGVAACVESVCVNFMDVGRYHSHLTPMCVLFCVSRGLGRTRAGGPLGPNLRSGAPRPGAPTWPLASQRRLFGRCPWRGEGPVPRPLHLPRMGRPGG